MRPGMEKSKVSVVVPIYNQETNLGTSIPCLMNQSWKNLEILAVNDGSTDKSEQMIADFAKEDERIMLINKPNGGLVDAVICGIENASGQYICFLDPDDVAGPDFVSNFMACIEDFDFVAMGYYDNNGERTLWVPLDEDRIFAAGDLEELKRSFFFRQGTDQISRQIFISRWNKCYKAALLKQLVPQLKEIREVSLGEDTIFTYLVLCHSHSGRAMKEPNCYVYNTGSGSSMIKHGAARNNLNKARIAYEQFSLLAEPRAQFQAVMLYYFQATSVVERLKYENSPELCEIYKELHHDPLYLAGYKAVRYKGWRRIKKLLWRLPTGSAYRLSFRILEKSLSPVRRVLQKTGGE